MDHTTVTTHASAAGNSRPDARGQTSDAGAPARPPRHPIQVRASFRRVVRPSAGDAAPAASLMS